MGHPVWDARYESKPNPFNKEFTEYELIENFGFPEDNLNAIDDEFWENY